MGLAASNYASQYSRFPPGYQGQNLINAQPATNNIYTTHLIEILTYLEEDNAVRVFDKTLPNGSSANANTNGGTDAITAQVIRPYRCPSSNLEERHVFKNSFWYGLTSYAGNAGTRIYPKSVANSSKQNNDGIFNIVEQGDTGIALRKITDGLSKTLLYGERNHDDPVFDSSASSPPLTGWSTWGWTSGNSAIGDETGHAAVSINYQLLPPTATQTQCDNRQNAWGSFHAGGANFCMADGSVTFLSDDMDLDTLRYMSTYGKQEVVTAN